MLPSLTLGIKGSKKVRNLADEIFPVLISAINIFSTLQLYFKHHYRRIKCSVFMIEKKIESIWKFLSLITGNE